MGGGEICMRKTSGSFAALLDQGLVDVKGDHMYHFLADNFVSERLSGCQISKLTSQGMAMALLVSQCGGNCLFVYFFCL